MGKRNKTTSAPETNADAALLAEACTAMDVPRLTTGEGPEAAMRVIVQPDWTEAERQGWQERGRREWAAEAPDRAAMALAVTVAGCEAALGHADAFGVLRLFDAAALDTFVTLRELAEGREGGEMRGAAPDPEAQHEKERLFGVAHALLEAR